MEKFLSIPSVLTTGTGTNTSVVADKLVDSTAFFNPLFLAGVQVGDVIINDSNLATATVTAVDSTTQLSLSDDIFTTSPVDYTIFRRDIGKPNLLINISNMVSITNLASKQLYFGSFSKGQTYVIDYRIPKIDSGSNTATGRRKVIDSAADFVTAGIKVGDVVEVASNKCASVVSVDSATELTLDVELFTNTGVDYNIYSNEVFYAMNNFVQDAVLELMRSKWNEIVLEIDDFPFLVVGTLLNFP